jgi:hypothetical protein
VFLWWMECVSECVSEWGSGEGGGVCIGGLSGLWGEGGAACERGSGLKSGHAVAVGDGGSDVGK